jgi:hypothetical protein
MLTKVVDVGLAFREVNLESVILIFNKKNKKDNSPLIFQALPLKKPIHKKQIIKLGYYDKDFMQDSNVIPMIELDVLDKKILNKINKNSIKLGGIAIDVFRSLYIPDAEKEELERGKIK